MTKFTVKIAELVSGGHIGLNQAMILTIAIDSLVDRMHTNSQTFTAEYGTRIVKSLERWALEDA